MPRYLLCSGTMVLAIVGTVGLAIAQDRPGNPAPPGVDPARQNSPHPGNKPEQNAKQEPSSRASTANDTRVFVNGTLNVSGAPQDGDTAPAKFSAKNAADDKLITAGHTFNMLTLEQRRAIYQSIAGKPQQPSDSHVVAEVGATLEPLAAVREFPAEVSGQVPDTKAYRYTMVGDQLVLVEPNTMFVVGVIDEKTGAGNKPLDIKPTGK